MTETEMDATDDGSVTLTFSFIDPLDAHDFCHWPASEVADGLPDAAVHADWIYVIGYVVFLESP
jgi:hypothetical protein